MENSGCCKEDNSCVPGSVSGDALLESEIASCGIDCVPVSECMRETAKGYLRATLREMPQGRLRAVFKTQFEIAFNCAAKACWSYRAEA